MESSNFTISLIYEKVYAVMLVEIKATTIMKLLSTIRLKSNKLTLELTAIKEN